jgi:uncharacterized protein (TIGR03382 family)
VSRVALVFLVACVEPPEQVDTRPQSLSDTVKRERATLIRDSAAEMGVHNAALLGGIATSETNLAHCWEEAQFACMGPATSSCRGGPIIAGSADGPCADEQGGLGMFQFDAGTYTQTIAMYGAPILTVEGNTAQAVAFVVAKVKLDVAGVNDWLAATAWLDSIPMVAGDPLTEEYSHLIACRYNGCCSGSSLCESRADGYRDNAIAIFDELGAEFWDTASRCVLASDGLIAPRSACYLAGGEPRFWQRTLPGAPETTMTTASAAANFARWSLSPGRATRYSIEVRVPADIGNAMATYRVAHAGTTTDVVVDQATAGGFVSLGDFDLAADGSEYVELADNTGTADQTLVFDTVRVLALDGADPGGEDAETGCCGASGGEGAFALAVLVLGLLGLPRRV